MTTTYRPTLRDRLIARRDRPPVAPEPLRLKPDGILAPGEIAAIDRLAHMAHQEDNAARNQLYMSLQPRLHRKGLLLRPWPNTPIITGLWDRDDVQQEGFIVFTELLAAWDGSKPFVPYLLARFPWRLRDRMLRGIGKPLPFGGARRVPEAMLNELLSAHDSDQPESAYLAARLLEHLLNSSLRNVGEKTSPLDVLTVLRSPISPAMRAAAEQADDNLPFSQIEAA